MKKQYLGNITRKADETTPEFSKRTSETLVRLQVRFGHFGEIIYFQGKKKSAFWLKRKEAK